ncbi:MAG: hypothetical protein EAZ78_07010 [Oscillatoriales cyanobacterium]|nr:MAG: hypothetical protein EAZ98_05250 [Oscillatoriales cyanobacterium]TAE06825.1 MAG: hypothetical protein EAZ96_00850 [Oscillatoriales cyanobacterium]TAF05066.1 MAG: hypothetical protein EAZ78_07010 [Oscillatoriales cyanobacterium]TAF42969.1 MAG: hypothetical protein EAZ68_09385 [Oscillatoriales cyanobacterium]TAF66758.1 MAG: hypothetical protein EAZ59_13710 [Oscillatoriales cyanobacterium]
MLPDLILVDKKNPGQIWLGLLIRVHLYLLFMGWRDVQDELGFFDSSRDGDVWRCGCHRQKNPGQIWSGVINQSGCIYLSTFLGMLFRSGKFPLKHPNYFR